MSKKYILSIGLFIAIVSCKPDTDKEKIRNELKKTDKEFSDLSIKSGMKNAFLKYIDEEAVILRSNHYPVVGKEKIEKLYEQVNDPSYELSWEPHFAEVSNCGDLGYTYGVYKVESANKVEKGTYVTIWKKNGNGQWKIVLDTGNEGVGE